MPVNFALHSLSKSFTFLSPANDTSWFFFVLLGEGVFDRVDNLPDGVAIDLNGVPAKLLEPTFISCQIMPKHCVLGLPHTVDIYEANEVVQFVERGKVSCLPNTTLSHFSISTYAEDAVTDLI